MANDRCSGQHVCCRPAHSSLTASLKSLPEQPVQQQQQQQHTQPCQAEHLMVLPSCHCHGSLQTVRRYVHPEGRAGFVEPQLGRAFRDAAYAAAGMLSPELHLSSLPSSGASST